MPVNKQDIENNKQLQHTPEEKVEKLKNFLSSLLGEHSKEMVLFQASKEYSGPLPTAEEYKGYEETLRGSADRILKVYEKNAASNIEERRIRLTESVKKQKRSDWMTFVVIVLLILGAFLYLLFGGEGKRAIVISSSSVLTLFLILYTILKNRK